MALFHKRDVFIILLIISSYLIIGTGLHGDDLTVISKMKNIPLNEFLTTPLDMSIFGPVSYYLYWWAYYFLGDDYLIIYDLIKILTMVVSIFYVYKFATNYLTENRALLASILFVFYPVHEATTYWYMTSSYILSPSLIMFGHYLIDRDSRYKGTLFATLGVFSGYMSPPYIFGLSVIFLVKKETKKALLFIFPGFLYLIYYFFIKFQTNVERRISHNLDALDYLKQLITQPISALDAIVGPSYWLKAIFAIQSIGWISILIAIFISSYFILSKTVLLEKPKVSKELIFGLASVLILSFFMYALTGLYQHSPFNLGNRSTVYVSLFLAFMLAMFLRSSKLSYIFLILMFLFPNFGLSDHWKGWNKNQLNIISNISSNQELKKIEKNSTFIVLGNTYSKLGPYSHIEFFSMPWHAKSVFKEYLKTTEIIPLTPHIEINDNILTDIKRPEFRKKIRKNIYLYYTEDDKLKKISNDELTKLVGQEKKIFRHWVQLFKNTFIADMIIRLSPRLSYLFI